MGGGKQTRTQFAQFLHFRNSFTMTNHNGVNTCKQRESESRRESRVREPEGGLEKHERGSEGQQDIPPQGPPKITDVQLSDCFYSCESTNRFMYKWATFMHDGFCETGWVWMSRRWEVQKMIPVQAALCGANSFTGQEQVKRGSSWKRSRPL